MHHLHTLQHNVAALDGKHTVPVDDLCTPEFMRAHSQFGSFDAMLEASPFKVESADDFRAIPDDQWDAFVRSVTSFESWGQMLQAAGREWAARKLNGELIPADLRGGATPDTDSAHPGEAMDAPVKTPNAFLCHSTADDGFVDHLARDLMANGVNVFNDEWEIRPGDSLTDRINQGIAGCDIFVAVLSPVSLDSKWVREELSAATVRRIEQKARIIPVLLTRCELPPLLSHLVWIGFDDYDTGLGRLLDAIFRPDRKPSLGSPPALIQRARARISGLTADDEALLAHVVQNSVEPLGLAFRGEELSRALEMTPQQVNDSVEVIESAGYVRTVNWMGTAPYNFGQVEATASGFIAAKHHLDYDPEDDVRRVAAAIVSLESASGSQLQESTGITPARVSRAVLCLDLDGLVDPVRGIGTAPFDFAYVQSTVHLRRYLAQEY